ncbi:hypothetical protein RM574_20955 [Streptomyces sp. DSM 41982]|uniref:Histone protein n=1 Tax=Streptomyces evansiae TaxID=3075535 RepID=A0ABD5E9T2_9ACTN|nr:hypothetical protein [Streptomyces sp. DSM 41982]MDT0417957.1 hypothetical protein [Streptomyces sp. DSM 41982]
MDDSDKLVLGTALVGGYLLGRTRKARLALVVASCLAGKRLNLTPQDLLTAAVRKLRETPQFAELSDQMREELLTAGRTAADRRLSALADTLAARTASLLEPPQEDTGEEEEPEEGGEEPRDEEEPEEAEEAEEEPAPRRPSRHRRPAKKAAAKKAPAKKTAAKRPPANNPGARKAAALRGKPTSRKEGAAKKAPAKKAAKRTTKSTAKRSASRGGRGR